MKKGFLFGWVFLVLMNCAFAQKIKTGVMVLGDGNAAVAAGVQSANSGVKTVLLLPGADYNLSLSSDSDSVGLAGDFKKLRDSLGDAGLGVALDSTKNLTVLRSVAWEKLKRSGRGWTMDLKDGRTVKADVLVRNRKDTAVWQSVDYADKRYRTSIAADISTAGQARILPLRALLAASEEAEVNLSGEVNSIALGQAAGATAAYAVFFGKKVSEASLKDIQGELIKYKLSLMPFADAGLADKHWRAIQFIGLAGIVKADKQGGKIYYRPDAKVSAEELEGVLEEYYYKAQIWFDDHKGADMTIASVLDMVCYVGGRSLANTEKDVKEKWRKSYAFSEDYDRNKVINRRQLAVLLYEYLNPFNVNIDHAGRVLR